MTEVPLAGGDPLPESLGRLVDQVCNRFEKVWKDGGYPRVEGYLGDEPDPVRSVLVHELVLLELHYRRKRGEKCEPEEYKARFPAQYAAWFATELAESSFTCHDPSPRDASPGATTLPRSRCPAAPDPAVLAQRTDLSLLRTHEIVEEIGRGGMGIVYRGRDANLGRDLALKALLEEHRGRPELVRRFVEEAQIGGQLQHPGIVPVHGLGLLPDGRPCFTMKLVHGRTLAALLAERSVPAQDQPRFLKIYEQVCQTLAYAHSRGVIHRDLKPANVMVGAFGEVQVMDWGLAKVLTAADEQPPGPEPNDTGTRPLHGRQPGADSQAGTVLGTYAYMSPEQARGQVAGLDRRCDVFGLGAILCEVLTGAPPYRRRDGVGASLQAEQADLGDAHARLDACSADADVIRLAKACLAADAGQRPRDAGEVADTIARHLNAVQERLRAAEIARASAQARAAEERRARRLTVSLATALLALVLLGGGGWLWIQQERATRVAAVSRQVHAALDQATRLRAEGQWTDSLAAAKRAEGLLAGTTVDPDLAQRVSTLVIELTELEQDRRMLARLDNARSQQIAVRDSFLEGPQADPSSSAVARHGYIDRSALGPAYADAFRTYGIDVERLDRAEASARIGHKAIRAQLASALDDWAYQISDGSMRKKLRRMARDGDPDADRARVRDLIENGDVESLKKLAASERIRDLPASTLTLLSLALQNSDRRAAGSVLQRAQQLHPDDFWVTLQLAYFHMEDGKEQLDEALRFLTAARALRPASAAVLCNLGSAYLDKEAWDESIEASQRAIELEPNLGMAYSNLGMALAARGEVDRALAAYREAICLQPKRAVAYSNMAHALYRKGQVADAIAAYHQALRLQPDLANAHGNLAFIQAAQGDWDQAIASYREALRCDPACWQARNNLGVLLCDRKRDYEGAIDAFHQALRQKPKLTEIYFNLGVAYADKGDVDKAIESYRQAIRLKPDSAMAYSNLARALLSQGADDAAISAASESIRLSGSHAPTLDILGRAWMKKRSWPDALAALQEAVCVDPENANAQTNLGTVLAETKQLHEAEAAFREALRLQPNLREARRNLAILLEGQERREEAIDLYRTLAEREDPAAYHELGKALERAGLLDEAVAAYGHAICADPDCTAAHLSLGVLLCDRMHDYTAAAQAFREVIRLAPREDTGHYNLGNALQGNRKAAEAEAAYRQAIAINSDYAEAHKGLADVLVAQGQWQDGLTAYRKAVTLQPAYVRAHFNLGRCLAEHGMADEAIGSYLEVVRLQPEYAEAHVNLGLCWWGAGQVDRAIAAFRRALQINPNLMEAHVNLASVLISKGSWEEAVVASRKAVELAPRLAEVHLNLGKALAGTRELKQAAAAFRQALALKPSLADAHYQLGNALLHQGLPIEAIPSYRQALEYQPELAEAHCNLGHALSATGQFSDALAALRRGHQLGIRDPKWSYPSAKWVRDAERRVELDMLLANVLAGKARAADPDEQMALAQFCQESKHLPAAATRFYTAAFTAQPKLAEPPSSGQRYNAACAAALAGCGQGQDDPPPDHAEKGRLRRQALDWLKADQAYWSQRAKSDRPRDRDEARETLEHWLQDPDLAGVRGDGIAKLPEAERQAWTELWRETDRLLATAGDKKP